MTNPIILLSNNTSTVTPSYISIISSPIFTVTSLSIFPLSRLQQDVLFTTLLSITNMLLLRSNQGLLDFPPYLNYSVYNSYCPHISSSYSGLLFIFYNFVLDGQILHNYSNSSPYPPPWYVGCMRPTLPFDQSTPLSHLFFLLSLPKQALLVPTSEELPIFQAKLETIAIVTQISLHCLTLGLVPYYIFIPSLSPTLSPVLVFMSFQCTVLFIPLFNSSISNLPL